MLGWFRMRRAMKHLYVNLTNDLPRLQSAAFHRPFDHDNNYFVTAMYCSAIKKAYKDKKYEHLKVYAHYLEQNLPLEGVWHATAVLLESQERPVGDIVHDRHVIVAHRLLTAFREHHDYELFKNYGTYRDVLRLAYQQPDQASNIVALVEQRSFDSVDEIRHMIVEFPDTPQPLLTGML